MVETQIPPATELRFPTREEAVLPDLLALRAEATPDKPFLIFEDEEWSYADIAGVLGCREGTVKSRIHRGRDRLREALAPYWAEGAP